MEKKQATEEICTAWMKDAIDSHLSGKNPQSDLQGFNGKVD